MAITTIDMSLTDRLTDGRVIDLRGHRLGELVQLLSGCGTEAAELAVGDLAPAAQLDEKTALDVLATALVRIKRHSRVKQQMRKAS